MPYAAMAVSVAAVSFAAIFIRLADAPPLVVSFYRLLFATLLLAPVAVIKSRNEIAALSSKQHLVLAGVGLALAVHFATWIASLSYTSVAASVTIVSTEAVFVTIGSHYVFRERVNRFVAAGVAIALAGGAVIAVSDSPASILDFGGSALFGDLLALLGAMSAAVYILAGRRLRRHMGIIAYATTAYFYTTLFLGVFLLAARTPLYPYPAESFGWIAALAVIPMLLGHTVFNWVLKYLPAHTVSASLLLEPAGSTLLAMLILSEYPKPATLAGAAAVLAGVYLAVVRGRRGD